MHINMPSLFYNVPLLAVGVTRLQSGIIHKNILPQLMSGIPLTWDNLYVNSFGSNKVNKSLQVLSLQKFWHNED